MKRLYNLCTYAKPIWTNIPRHQWIIQFIYLVGYALVPKMLARDYGQPRDALALEVLRNGLATYRTCHWPSEILAFQGVTDMPPFESYRNELCLPNMNPLA